MDTIIRLAATCVLILVLCSCGGEGERSQHDAATARVSLRIAAEPIEWVEEVVLQIRGVVFVSRDGGKETYYEPGRVTPISLIAAGPSGSVVFPEMVLVADEYMMVRIEVDAVENVSDSYVRSLRGEECELRTASSDVVAYGYVDLREKEARSVTVVMNLHRSLHPAADCVTGYSLRSVGHDVVDDRKAGWIAGSVDPSLVTAGCEPKVYVFLWGAIVDDVADVIPPHDNPVSVAKVDMQQGGYRYRTRALLPLFVPKEPNLQASPLCQSTEMCLSPASYLLAFTCDADHPILDEAIRFGPFAGMIVQGGVASEVNFSAPRGDLP